MADMAEPGDPSKLMSVREAIDVIDRAEVRPRVVRVPLGQADGLRLAADVVADRDYPPFAKSLMDGYAVRGADVVGKAAAELRVVGELAAGTTPDKGVLPGEAIAIMTGAPMPAGADGVVPVEDAERRPPGGPAGDTVRILRPGQPARYVAARGSDCVKGTVVLKRGTAIGPQQVAVLATVGAAEVEAYDRPSVAVLSTGDELAEPGAAPEGAKIRNSNGPMLVALLRRMGCRVTDLGQCRDEPGLLREALRAGLDADALFVTGGMSMGEYDYVPRLLRELGVELRVTKLRIKPGKPFVFGVGRSSEFGVQNSAARDQVAPMGASTTAGGLNSELGTLNSGPSFVFGLPGNPVSAFVCTVRLASRLLERMAGGEVRENWQTGRLEVGMVPNGPREFYQPVVRYVAAGRNSAQSVLASIRPLTWKGSADLFTLAAANALLVRAENEPALPMGTVVKVLEI
jgi:molybdopterin molybdotransferase